jgi:hypothetical protein
MGNMEKVQEWYRLQLFDGCNRTRAQMPRHGTPQKADSPGFLIALKKYNSSACIQKMATN